MLDVSRTTPVVGQHQPDCEMVLHCFIACILSVLFSYCSVLLIWVEGYSYQFEMFYLRTNNCSDYIVEQSSGLRLENLNKVTGKELFKDAQYLVR